MARFGHEGGVDHLTVAESCPRKVVEVYSTDLYTCTFGALGFANLDMT